jgi:hypothetical protein
MLPGELPKLSPSNSVEAPSTSSLPALVASDTIDAESALALTPIVFPKSLIADDDKFPLPQDVVSLSSFIIHFRSFDIAVFSIYTLSPTPTPPTKALTTPSFTRFHQYTSNQGHQPAVLTPTHLGREPREREPTSKNEEEEKRGEEREAGKRRFGLVWW